MCMYNKYIYMENKINLNKIKKTRLTIYFTEKCFKAYLNNEILKTCVIILL